MTPIVKNKTAQKIVEKLASLIDSLKMQATEVADRGMYHTASKFKSEINGVGRALKQIKLLDAYNGLPDETPLPTRVPLSGFSFGAKLRRLCSHPPGRAYVQQVLDSSGEMTIYSPSSPTALFTEALRAIRPLTRLQASMLIHFSAKRSDPYPKAHLPAQYETIVQFLNDGIITQSDEAGCFETTARGDKWVEVLLGTPPPLIPAPPRRGCKYDTDGDGNCPRHPGGCPK